MSSSVTALLELAEKADPDQKTHPSVRGATRTSVDGRVGVADSVAVLRTARSIGRVLSSRRAGTAGGGLGGC